MLALPNSLHFSPFSLKIHSSYMLKLCLNLKSVDNFLYVSISIFSSFLSMFNPPSHSYFLYNFVRCMHPRRIFPMRGEKAIVLFTMTMTIIIISTCDNTKKGCKMLKILFRALVLRYSQSCIFPLTLL